MAERKIEVVGVVFVDGDFDFLLKRDCPENVKELLYSEQYSGIVSLQGFEDLEFAPISTEEGNRLVIDSDCVDFIKKLIMEKQRGEFIGYAMLKDGVLAIREVEPFSAIIQPKQLGATEEAEYTKYVDSTAIEESDVIEEVSEILFNIV